MITAQSIIPSGGGFSTIRIETISTAADFAGAGSMSNSGDTLRWSVTGGVELPEVIDDNPELDLSVNTGLAIVTIRNSDRFQGLTTINLVDQRITTIDVRRCRALGSLVLEDNTDLTAIDLSRNLLLELLNLRGCNFTSLDISANVNLGALLLTSNSITALNISANVSLSVLLVAGNNLTALDISTNTDLEELHINNNALSSAAIDAIIIALDNHGLSNGILHYANQTPAANPTAASLAAYLSLIAKGWTITGAVPA